MEAAAAAAAAQEEQIKTAGDAPDFQLDVVTPQAESTAGQAENTAQTESTGAQVEDIAAQVESIGAQLENTAAQTESTGAQVKNAAAQVESIGAQATKRRSTRVRKSVGAKASSKLGNEVRTTRSDETSSLSGTAMGLVEEGYTPAEDPDVPTDQNGSIGAQVTKRRSTRARKIAGAKVGSEAATSSSAAMELAAAGDTVNEQPSGIAPQIEAIGAQNTKKTLTKARKSADANASSDVDNDVDATQSGEASSSFDAAAELDGGEAPGAYGEGFSDAMLTITEQMIMEQTVTEEMIAEQMIIEQIIAEQMNTDATSAGMHHQQHDQHFEEQIQMSEMDTILKDEGFSIIPAESLTSMSGLLFDQQGLGDSTAAIEEARADSEPIRYSKPPLENPTSSDGDVTMTDDASIGGPSFSNDLSDGLTRAVSEEQASGQDAATTTAADPSKSETGSTSKNQQFEVSGERHIPDASHRSSPEEESKEKKSKELQTIIWNGVPWDGVVRREGHPTLRLSKKFLDLVARVAAERRAEEESLDHENLPAAADDHPQPDGEGDGDDSPSEEDQATSSAATMNKRKREHNLPAAADDHPQPDGKGDDDDSSSEEDQATSSAATTNKCKREREEKYEEGHIELGSVRANEDHPSISTTTVSRKKRRRDDESLDPSSSPAKAEWTTAHYAELEKLYNLTEPSTHAPVYSPSKNWVAPRP